MARTARRRERTVALAAVGLLAGIFAGTTAACDGDDAHDAGAARDAGVARDLGAAVDSGLVHDAGVERDAGATVDSGGEQDAGLEGDSGFRPVFTNHASEVGFHSVGAIHGRGAAWVDVDGDGWEDVWQVDAATGTAPYLTRSTLFRNGGDGTFSRFELGIDAADLYANWSSVWGDFDNDGDPDVFLVNGGYTDLARCALYRNDLATGGSLTNVTVAAGVTGEVARWWGGAAADYDGDSWLDVAVVAFEGPVALYHNRGDGTFEEVSEAVGVADSTGFNQMPVWFDFDADGDQDLFIANRSGDSRLWRNTGGVFGDVTAGVVSPPSAVADVFAAAAADFDQDGWEDLYVGSLFGQDYVLVNDAGRSLVAHGIDIGLVEAPGPSGGENTMGVAVGDLNADGYPDVFTGPGLPLAALPPIVFCNAGSPLRFFRCSEDFIAGHGAARHHGTVFADPDHDGDMDVFMSLGGDVVTDLATGTESRELSAFYVQDRVDPSLTAVVHLVGTRSNASAVGARITVGATAARYHTVHSTQGFPGQNSDWIVLALGGASAPVEVRWPAGGTTIVELSVGERRTITEPP